MSNTASDRWTWSDPPRRGIDWELIYSDTRGELEIQRCDCQDCAETERSGYFTNDDEAALYVINTATNGHCPRPDIQDECRNAIRELTEWWSEGEP